MADESPFVLDPNKCYGYPSVYDIPEIPDSAHPYEIDTRVRSQVYGTFTHTGSDTPPSSIEYPSFGEVIAELPYTIVSQCRPYVYGNFTHIGSDNPSPHNKYPSYGDPLTELPFTIVSQCRVYVYGNFTDIGSDNPSPPNKYPSYGEELVVIPYTIPTHELREYVYGHFTHIGSDTPTPPVLYPSYGEELVEIPFIIPTHLREYVYGHFTDIGSDHALEPGKIKVDGYPVYNNTPKHLITFGACSFTDVNTVEIPKSVVFIADYAFWDSRITSVKINRHCVYYNHSFPPGCHIKPYRDDE